MLDKPISDILRQLTRPQRIEIERRPHEDAFMVVRSPEKTTFRVPEMLNHPVDDGRGAPAPHLAFRLHPQGLGHHGQRAHLHTEVRVQVGRLHRHLPIPEWTVVKPRGIGVVVLRQAVHVIVVHAEPPGVPTYQRHVDLAQKIDVGIGLVELERCPGQDGRFSHFRPEGMADLGDDALVVDRVGQHAVGQLAI